jgi:hypothetical protein
MEQATPYIIAATQEKPRLKRVKSHCIVVPIMTTTRLINILSAMDRKFGRTQWRVSHNIATGEYIISMNIRNMRKS